MLKVNILKLMYKYSPMNFYRLDNQKTTIKSTNNTSLGYEFQKEFTTDEIDSVWREIRVHKRFSTISIFILFIFLLYQLIFPKFTLFVNLNWYINALIILALITILYHIINLICQKIFEKRLKNCFGDFVKTKFIKTEFIDKKYYRLFKIELFKALIAILVIIIGFCSISPFDICQKLIDKKHYQQAIRLTTIGSRIFPIAQEWYSLRGYARYKLADYQGAIIDYDRAYSLSADDDTNIMNFDNKIFIKYSLGDYDSALNDFDKEIKNANSEDERDQFMWDKAQFLYNIGKFNEALELYNELIVKSESDRIFLLKDRLYLERAQVYKMLGEKELAQKDIESSEIQDEDSNRNPIPKPVLILNEETFD